jgi:hypothetical protein
MTTDRKLLELAAKAASVPLEGVEADGRDKREPLPNDDYA